MSEKEKNPLKRNGRPQNAKTKTKATPEFSELAKNKSVDALERLMSITEDENAKPEVIVKACETVIAYGYGKPGQTSSEPQNSGVKVEVDYD